MPSADKALVWIISLAVAVGCGLFSAKFAGDKGQRPVGYCLLGFFLPLIGVIVAAVIPREQ